MRASPSIWKVNPASISLSSYHMIIKPGLSKRTRAYERDRDNKRTLFYLFFIAQLCSLFCLVVGILFFILRFFRIIWLANRPVDIILPAQAPRPLSLPDFPRAPRPFHNPSSDKICRVHAYSSRGTPWTSLWTPALKTPLTDLAWKLDMTVSGIGCYWNPFRLV